MSKIGQGMSRHREKTLLAQEQKRRETYLPPKIRTAYRGEEKAAEQAGKVEVQPPAAPMAQNIELRLQSHLDHLKNIKSKEEKAILKKEWLPDYQGFIDASLAQSPAPQNTVLMYLMAWAIDAQEFDLAFRIGQHGILNNMAMPEGFKRGVAEVLAEQISEACNADVALAEHHATLLKEIAEVIQGENIVDEIRAKLYKAIGLGFDKTQPSEALAAYKIALRLNINSGVKTRITQLEKQLNRSTTESSPDAPGGSQADTTITVDDHDSKLQLPKRGVKVNCKLGWQGGGLYDKGDFVVDETEWAGSPDTITVRASSANFKSAAKSANSKSFHQKTLGEISHNIAQTNNLILNISDELASVQIQHVDQTNESDLNFLKRLAKANGAEMAIKKDQVLLFTAGSGLTASGKQLPAITLTRNDGDQFRYNEEDRDSDYTGVAAYYTDAGKKTRKRATAGNPEQYGGGNDPNTKTKVLKGTFASEQEAQRAAEAAMATKNRQMAKFSITTAYGVPEISTESPVKLSGFKREIDRLNWIVAKATHSYSTSGLTTQLELESSF